MEHHNTRWLLSMKLSFSTVLTLAALLLTASPARAELRIHPSTPSAKEQLLASIVERIEYYQGGTEGIALTAGYLTTTDPPRYVFRGTAGRVVAQFEDRPELGLESRRMIRFLVGAAFRPIGLAFFDRGAPELVTSRVYQDVVGQDDGSLFVRDLEMMNLGVSPPLRQEPYWYYDGTAAGMLFLLAEANDEQLVRTVLRRARTSTAPESLFQGYEIDGMLAWTWISQQPVVHEKPYRLHLFSWGWYGHFVVGARLWDAAGNLLPEEVRWNLKVTGWNGEVIDLVYDTENGLLFAPVAAAWGAYQVELVATTQTGETFTKKNFAYILPAETSPQSLVLLDTALGPGKKMPLLIDAPVMVQDRGLTIVDVCAQGVEQVSLFHGIDVLTNSSRLTVTSRGRVSLISAGR